MEIVDRYPIEDRKKHRFPENSQYVSNCVFVLSCSAVFLVMQKLSMLRMKNGNLISLRFASLWSRFLQGHFICSDHSRSYGTSLFYYEKLSIIPKWTSCIEIDGEYRYDKKGRHLYVPRSLCILSHQPIFSVFSVFLRELYRNSIINTEDTFADEKSPIPRVESFEALLRKGTSSWLC